MLDSNANDPLEGEVEALYGPVEQFYDAPRSKNVAMFRGRLELLENGRQVVQFNNIYLIEMNTYFPNIYGRPFFIKDCYSLKGDYF